MFFGFFTTAAKKFVFAANRIAVGGKLSGQLGDATYGHDKFGRSQPMTKSYVFGGQFSPQDPFGRINRPRSRQKIIWRRAARYG
jgi:hypothetical protein